MLDPLADAFAVALNDRLYMGQIAIRQTASGFVLSHRDDEARNDLQAFRDPEIAIEIAKYDDVANYRPLKTAPNLQHGWRFELADHNQLERALEYFYPGRLAIFRAWKNAQLQVSPLRDTLDRQSGMYRVAAKISDSQIDDVVGDFCRSDGGCLRTILWKRDRSGNSPSTKLPPEKFDVGHDQAAACTSRASGKAATIPLLCQEPCNLLVAECRRAVKGEDTIKE